MSQQRESLSRSLDFFTDPRHYVPFSQTTDKKEIVGCIDPRDEEDDDLKVIVQTPGGAYGEGLDAALAMTVVRGELVPIVSGIGLDAETRRISDVVDAHEDCAFLKGIVAVLEEEAAPSEFTLETLERWGRLYQKWDVVKPAVAKLRPAAARHLEHVRAQDISREAQEAVKTAYPAHANYRHMRGANRAQIYAVTHHPNVGLDRNAKHRQAGLEVQGYHDSLSRMANNLAHRRVNNRYRGLRLGGLFLRSAATRTVIGRKHKDPVFLEAFPSDNQYGLVVKELEGEK